MPLKKLLSVFVALIAPVLLVAFLPFNPVHADIIDINVRPVWTNYNATWQFYTNRFSCQSGGYCWGADSVNQFDGRADGATVRKIRFSLPNSLNLTAGSYITADFYIRQSAANNANDTLIGPIKSDTSHITLIDTNVAPASNTNYLIRMTFYVETDLHVTNNSTYVTVGSTRGNDYNIIWQFESGNLLTGGVVNTYTAVKNTDYTTKLNEISSGITNLNSKLNASNTKLDTMNSKLNDLKNAQEQANQDAQDRYDQDKQEESQRENSNNTNNNQLGSLFNFNLLNPFAPIFNLFSGSCSVSIPTIAGWINAPSSTYTSWWCSNSTMTNIRSTLTPVLGLSSSMLLFAFIVRKVLNGSQFNGGIEIE